MNPALAFLIPLIFLLIFWLGVWCACDPSEGGPQIISFILHLIAIGFMIAGLWKMIQENLPWDEEPSPTPNTQSSDPSS